MRRNLYDKKVSLEITIDKEYDNIVIEVYDNVLRQPYIPFYNREANKNNEILEKVLEKYNKTVKDLLEKGILIYDE